MVYPTKICRTLPRPHGKRMNFKMFLRFAAAVTPALTSKKSSQ